MCVCARARIYTCASTWKENVSTPPPLASVCVCVFVAVRPRRKKEPGSRKLEEGEEEEGGGRRKWEEGSRKLEEGRKEAGSWLVTDADICIGSDPGHHDL